MTPYDLANLEAITSFKKAFGKDIPLVRAGVSLTLYSATPLDQLGPFVADALLAYLQTFPEAKLDASLGSDKYKAFSAAGLKRLLADLRSLAPGDEFMEVHLKEGVDAACGGYAFHFEGSQLQDAERPLETNLIVFEWPASMGLDASQAQRIVDFSARLLTVLPLTSGSAGYAFQRPQTYPSESLDIIQRLMPRYLGLDPSYRRCRFRMRQHLPTAQWLMLVGSELASGIPELKAQQLKGALPAEVQVVECGEGALIKASDLPFIGDVNRGASDLGAVPAVARALRPWRYDITGFGGRVDASDWLTRFDSRP
jgi:hypothetical protein